MDTEMGHKKDHQENLTAKTVKQLDIGVLYFT
jgi:hypothetical protein